LESVDMLKIDKYIKIRDEGEFYLLVNLDDRSIIDGYASFMKINSTGKWIIDNLLNGIDYKKLVGLYSDRYKISEDLSENDLKFFLDKLVKLGLLGGITYDRTK